MMDDLSKLCLAFTLVPIVAFALCVYAQYINIQKKTYRLTVLCIRTALFLPLYALLMLLSAIYPQVYVILIVLITIIEGYSFYCFFALITTNLGGPAATVDLMYQSQRKLFCSCCCPSDSAIFYQKTTWAIFHLFITRSILSALSAVCFYAQNPSGKAAYTILNTISACILFNGVISLVNLYENVFEHCKNLFGVLKLLLLKISVGAIVVLGLVESFLYSSGTSPFKDDDEFNAEEKTLRAYCLIVLGEFVLLSFVYYYAFGYKVITASPVASKTASGENNIEAQHIYNYITAGPTTSLLDGENLNIASGSSRSSSSGNLVTTGGGEKPRFSFWTFALDVLRLHDVVGTLTYKSDLYQNVDQGDGELR